MRRSNRKRRIDKTLKLIYIGAAILLTISGIIDVVRGEGKLALIEFLIVAILIPAIVALRNRDKQERMMPAEEPPPRWY